MSLFAGFWLMSGWNTITFMKKFNRVRNALHINHLYLLPTLMAGLLLMPVGWVTAQTFMTLHSFTNSSSDGSGCYAGLIASGNTLYGTTVSGGSSGNGTVFKVNADGTGYTNLHSFNYTAGANPYGTLILSDDRLYGTTFGGGNSGYGTVFAVNTNGTGFTNLHSFAAGSGTFPKVTNSEGANPFSGLVLSGNTLYGNAHFGGSASAGTVFAVHTDGTGFTNLHSFTATSGSPATNSQGANPHGGLVLSGNTLYGTTINGGISGSGTVFALNTDGSDLRTLHSFDWSTNGSNPRAIIISGNTLYGTASSGADPSSGTVFALNTNGMGFTNLHIFIQAPYSTNVGGASPFGRLVLSGNALYGTTLGGGSSGKGTVFAVNTDGSNFTSLYTFTGTSGSLSTNSEGASLRAGLLVLGNTLYGTADRGGTWGSGTVFGLSLPSPPELKIIHSGTDLVLTWPSTAAGFILYCTTNLALPNTWLEVEQVSVTNAFQISVTLPASAEQKFFRLKSQ